MSDRPTFTVFIPSYNRADTIGRALDSVRCQTVDDYEIVVVDDGSTDSTEAVVRGWEREYGIPVRYHRQPNGGKHRAHNTAVDLARGELLMVLDSDDVMKPTCLADILSAWREIPAAERAAFAGVEGLCETGDGTLHGTPYPADTIDGTHLEMAGRHGVTGEKRNAIRVDVLKQYPYPEFPGEYHVRPSFLWKRLAAGYRFRFINKVLHEVDFADGGLTRTASARRLKNVRGLYAYWQDDVLHHQRFLAPRQRRKHYSEYIRYALHTGVSIADQWREVPDRRLWLAALPRGLPNYWADRVKARRILSR